MPAHYTFQRAATFTHQQLQACPLFLLHGISRRQRRVFLLNTRFFNTRPPLAMSKGEPSPGTSTTATLTVKSSDLASALPLNETDAFPAVFATARMIALMEIAASRALQPHLEDGELSVGVDVQATHTAGTPEGMDVTATANYIGREGKLYKFEIVASDAGGQVGSASHTRAVVQTERLEGAAASRIQKAAQAKA